MILKQHTSTSVKKKRLSPPNTTKRKTSENKLLKTRGARHSKSIATKELCDSLIWICESYSKWMKVKKGLEIERPAMGTWLEKEWSWILKKE